MISSVRSRLKYAVTVATDGEMLGGFWLKQKLLAVYNDVQINQVIDLMQVAIMGNYGRA